MGYTHYWRQTKDYAPSAWERICENVNTILRVEHGVPLLAEYDEPGTLPEVSDERIRFNGVDDDGHETFFVSPKRPPLREWQEKKDRGFGFCKTANKPYDVVVVAILAYLAVEGFRVSSDGDTADWKEGVALAKQALPHLKIEVPKAVAE